LQFVFGLDFNPIQKNLTSNLQNDLYLKGTTIVGLWYPSHSPIHLVDYFDSDFAECKLDRKSTSETCHIFGSSLISWHNKKQACVTLSIESISV